MRRAASPPFLSGRGGFRRGSLGRIRPLDPECCEDRHRSDCVNTELPMPDPKLLFTIPSLRFFQEGNGLWVDYPAPLRSHLIKCPESNGIGVRITPEWVSGMPRNTQRVSNEN